MIRNHIYSRETSKHIENLKLHINNKFGYIKEFSDIIIDPFDLFIACSDILLQRVYINYGDSFDSIAIDTKDGNVFPSVNSILSQSLSELLHRFSYHQRQQFIFLLQNQVMENSKSRKLLIEDKTEAILEIIAFNQFTQQYMSSLRVKNI